MGRLLEGFRDREDELVRRAHGGDRGAFDEIVRREFVGVYALLFRFTGNHEDAEDLAQECFVRAWNALANLRDSDALSPWLGQIALRLARDRHRMRTRRGTPEGLDSEPPDRGRAPAEELGGNELMLRLRAALERLPHRLRAPLYLRVLEGREYDEVAALTGVKPETARTQVMHARRLLLRWLRPLLEGGRP
jgi:RNA polymerase sigma-70 factor, ECF subfamily